MTTGPQDGEADGVEARHGVGLGQTVAQVADEAGAGAGVATVGHRQDGGRQASFERFEEQPVANRADRSSPAGAPAGARAEPGHGGPSQRKSGTPGEEG